VTREIDRGGWRPTYLASGPGAIEADVTDRDSLVAAAERVQDELGGADVLINNAGVMLLGPFSSQQRADPAPTNRSAITARAQVASGRGP
jgi:NAD(P)-dependent dehydrogenase (short-subunit alcohol dehydrogenase family)